MDDIAPVLLEKIESDFAEGIAKNSTVQSVLERANLGTATQFDAHEYALQVGKASSSALQNVITEDALPDGRLYFNIADRTVRPTIERSHAMINETAAQIQKVLNERAGIGMNPVLPELDQDRLGRLIDKLSSGETFSDVAWLLDEPVVNLVESFTDEFIRANAEFQARAGLSPKIQRTVVGKCCDWCAALAGVYDYWDDMPDDIFRRHQFCRCTVTFSTGRFFQDVHSKRWYDVDQNALTTRKLVNTDITALTPGDAAIREKLLVKQAEEVEKKRINQLIAKYELEYDVSHRRAANRVGRAIRAGKDVD